MNEQIKEYIEKYPSDIIDIYNTLRKLISCSCKRINKKMPEFNTQ